MYAESIVQGLQERIDRLKVEKEDRHAAAPACRWRCRGPRRSTSATSATTATTAWAASRAVRWPACVRSITIPTCGKVRTTSAPNRLRPGIAGGAKASTTAPGVNGTVTPVSCSLVADRLDTSACTASGQGGTGSSSGWYSLGGGTEVVQVRTATTLVAEGARVLVGEDRRRDEHGDLPPALHRLERGAHGDLGLAVADVADEQAVHRPRALEVLLHVLGRLALVGRVLEEEGGLELPLPRRVGRSEEVVHGAERTAPVRRTAGRSRSRGARSPHGRSSGPGRRSRRRRTRPAGFARWWCATSGP